ncbi:DUF1206 domain-containing protein [Adhaeribacter soli]|uniref:DUF1206 domain-containing protein n=1 Tax=Adhaeribacter soli TaxID=2607655 RepID=A0A5N1INL8_9BACT|nr:DUF1206 domain-containing protein [Adhaeribacter soli]KAA9331115.1 DUF1206 domain-containing protein [Adhaeribacter soli]
MKNITAAMPSPPPKWVERFARIGLLANGLVYCLVGLLAFMAAFGLRKGSQENADREGVFKFVLEQPFGKVLLLLIALGLAFYSLWRLIQALKDTEQRGENLKGLGRRAGYLFSGVMYGGFAIAAFRLALGSGGSGKGDQRETLAQKVLEQPMGQWLLILIGLGVIGSGLYQIYRGVSNKYKKKVAGSNLKHETEEMMVRAGKAGYVARGIVWGLIGYFFIQAALHFNPSEAGGTGQAFRFLESSFGSILLGAVAVGLICYGAFMFMRAKYQPIKTA